VIYIFNEYIGFASRQGGKWKHRGILHTLYEEKLIEIVYQLFQCMLMLSQLDGIIFIGVIVQPQGRNLRLVYMLKIVMNSPRLIT
jgi:hypothetical protein